MDTRDFRPGLSETEMVKPTRLLSFAPPSLSLSLPYRFPCCSGLLDYLPLFLILFLSSSFANFSVFLFFSPLSLSVLIRISLFHRESSFTILYLCVHNAVFASMCTHCTIHGESVVTKGRATESGVHGVFGRCV